MVERLEKTIRESDAKLQELTQTRKRAEEEAEEKRAVLQGVLQDLAAAKEEAEKEMGVRAPGRARQDHENMLIDNRETPKR